MRVVAGAFRGRMLTAPAGLETRPITDRVKESLFNILGHRYGTPGGLPAFEVLDIFAGTGSLGIEALSRGARACVFVERDRRALGALRANVRQFGLGDHSTILTDNAWTMRPPESEKGFGLVFVDPPYRDATDPPRVIDLLERLAPGVAAAGTVVFRHEATSPPLPAEELRGLRCVDERVFRQMRLIFLERVTPPSVETGD